MANTTSLASTFSEKIKSIFINILLLLLGAFLFAFSNPGFVFEEGISLLAWISYVPIFILVYRTSIKTTWIYGFIYGVISYMLYVSWLVIFTPVGSIAIEAMYGVMLALVFVFMKLSMKLFSKKGFFIAFLVFIAYEYLKTTGFAGFSYGVTAYTQWKNLLLIQCADIAGVWTLCALIVFPSAWISLIIVGFINKKSFSFKSLITVAKEHKISAFLWLACLAFALIYGAVAQKDYSDLPTVKVAAIQHNTDPWVGGIDAYSKDVNELLKLSTQALELAPDTALVVWPETSIVPSIMRHYRERKDRRRFDLIKSFLDYVESQNAVFVIGNDHSIDVGSDTADYNSAMVFVPHKNTLPPNPVIYRKIHLVPFTESFPWPEQFPSLYQALLAGDTHLWTQGSEYTVFHEAGLSFSTPICFEDTFGDGTRNMYKAGARALVNLSNDAWSKSQSCQNQHLAMARFRSIECRIPAVRSTASGQTCIIDPNGKIQVMADSFVRTFITGELPVIPDTAKPTLYVTIGDIVGKLIAISAVFVIFAGIVVFIVKKLHSKSEE